MDNLQDQITTLRQQNEQILSALHSLQSEFRAFQAQLLGAADPYQSTFFSPSCTPEQREQVVRIFQRAVKEGTRDVCYAILVLEQEGLLCSCSMSEIYRNLHERFHYRPGLSALKKMKPDALREYNDSPDYYHHLVLSWS